MKKMFVLCMAMFLLIGSFGCSKDNGTVNSVPSQNAQPSGGAADTGAGTGTTAPTQETSGADIVLEKAYWSTINPELNENVELKLKIKSAGTEAVNGFDYNVRITKDGTTWKDETKTFDETLYPGNSTKIELTYTFTSEGKYAAEVYLDKDNKLNEKNRFNNVQISTDANAIKATSTATGGSDDEESDTTDGSTGSCTDTDGGKDETVQGECNDGVTTLGIKDYCASSSVVKEYYCGTDGRCKTENIDCDSGCEDGACI